MAQYIYQLANGSLVGVQENDQVVPYQKAGVNIHGTNTVTLVRRDGYGSELQWHSALTSQVYNQSSLDQFMRDFESKYSVLHRAQLLNTAITYYRPGTPNSETILRKVFALSLTEVGAGANNGVNENAQLPIFTDNASRVKANLPANGWWLRSMSATTSTAALRVSTSGNAAYNLSLGKTATSLTAVPAHVVPSGLLVSDNPDPVTNMYTIIYPDSTPDKPVLLSPVNVYADVESQITFEWQHVNSSGTAQTKADLQYSHDGGDWTALTTITGAAASYTLPENSLLPGNLRWRARTYNTDNAAGAWSDPAGFIGVGPPPTPTITGVTNVSRPTVSWQSVGQEGYQLQLLHDGDVIYDTGEIASGQKSVVLPLYLANDTYTVRVKIINASLLWSAWSAFEFTLTATLPDTPSIAVTAIADGARITASDIDADAAHVYLLRDGVPVAEITGLGTYDDYAALGVSEYVVRVVDSGENSADSAPATVTAVVSGAVLAAADELDGIVRMRLKAAGQPAVTRQKQLIGTPNNFAGREHPVFTFSEFSSEVLSPSYYYTSFADWAELEALVNRRRTVLYRDALGNKVYGAVATHNFTQEDDRIMFTLSIQRVDYREQIDYAEVGA